MKVSGASGGGSSISQHPRTNKVRAFVEASHLGSSLAFTLLVLITTIPDWSSDPIAVVYSATAVITGTCSGFLLNEVWDARYDAIDKGYRPLPSKRLSRKAAITSFVSLYALAWLATVACLVETPAAWLLAVFLVVGLAYTPLKYLLGEIKNPLCAGIFTLPIAFGFALTDRLNARLIAVAAIFLFLAYRELVMDIADRVADQRAGIRSIPVRIGVPASLTLAATLWGAAMVLIPLMGLQSWQQVAWIAVLLISTIQFLAVLRGPGGPGWRRLTMLMWIPMIGYGILLI